MFSVFWLFWLSCHYLPSDWLERPPLRKPNRGEGIISIKPRPKSAHDFLGLLYCFIVLLCICVVFCPYVIYYPTIMARYSLFVLKVPWNLKQTNKQNINEFMRSVVFVMSVVSKNVKKIKWRFHCWCWVFHILKNWINLWGWSTIIVTIIMTYCGATQPVLRSASQHNTN